MSKRSNNQSRRQKREQKLKARRGQKASGQKASGQQQPAALENPHALLSTRLADTKNCLPKICVDEQGHLVEDPRVLLGLPAGPLTEAAVREAWRAKLLLHPPEQDPEGARRLREARDRLLTPERVVERLLGELYVPDPAAYGFAAGAPAPAADARLDALARLSGQALLYALVEDALLHNPPPKPTSGTQLTLL